MTISLMEIPFHTSRESRLSMVLGGNGSLVKEVSKYNFSCFQLGFDFSVQPKAV
jgi:hypothetical protein